MPLIPCRFVVRIKQTRVASVSAPARRHCGSASRTLRVRSQVVRCDPASRRCRTAVAPPARRHCGGDSRTLQVCSSGLVRGDPVLGAEAPHTASHNTGCVFCLATSTLQITTAVLVIPCRFGVLGKPFVGSNGVYTANYTMRCVSLHATIDITGSGG